MKKAIKYLLLLLSTGYLTSEAQTTSNVTQKYTLNFNYQKKKVPDTLSVRVFPQNNYFYLPDNYRVIKNKANNFEFEFPSTGQPLLFQIFTCISGSYMPLSEAYYASPGDQIKMEVFETSRFDSIIFTGKGMHKYNLIEHLLRDEKKFQLSLNNSKNDIPIESLNSDLRGWTSLIMQQINRKEAVILNFDQGISQEMKKLISYQFANYDKYWRGKMSYLNEIHINDSKYRIILNEFFNANYKSFLKRPEEVSILSPAYYTSTALMFNLLVNVNSKTNDGGDFIKYYNLIKNYSNSPRVRERILSQFLMKGKDRLGLAKVSSKINDSLTDDASKYLFSTKGKSIISEKIKLKSGATFYDAKFVNLKGKIFDTSSLRGKVFIIDLWASGCKGCAQFHEMFDKELWPSLKDNKNFEFISVCINEKKDRWIADLKSGTYSSSDYINVYTGENGKKDHAFIKYYDVQAVPFLLIIDKEGKIIQKVANTTVSAQHVYELLNKGFNDRFSTKMTE